MYRLYNFLLTYYLRLQWWRYQADHAPVSHNFGKWEDHSNPLNWKLNLFFWGGGENREVEQVAHNDIDNYFRLNAGSVDPITP